jgi:predicted NBD/HSP70 family sugar kinase
MPDEDRSHLEDRRHSHHNQINLERAAREIRRRGVAHSGHIAEATGLGANRSNKLINALRDNGLVTVGSEREFERRTPITLHGDAGCVVGVDMTMNRITVAVGDLEYVLLNDPSKTATQVPVGSWEETLDIIAVAIAQELSALRDDVDVVGVGLGLPGPVQRGSGSPESDHLLPGWEGIPTVSELESRLERAGIHGCPVVVGNDASLGALGVVTRAIWGNPESAPEDLLYVRVTHGVGLGVVMKGHLVTGADGFAGEIGHVRVQLNGEGPICVRCNSRGCLEVVASEKAVIDMLQGHAWHEGELGPKVVEDFVDAKDARTREVVGRAGWNIAFVLAAAANVLNPRWILLGGDMTKMGFFRDTFEETLRKYALPQALLRLRTVTWGSIFDDQDFPLLRGRDIGAGITPELLGAMAFVIDELGDSFMRAKVEQITF